MKDSGRYWLETYGCQMNSAESDALEIQLAARGWLPSERPEDADLIILNTCSVRQTAENRIWGRLGYFQSLKEENKLKIAVMGCMAERLKDQIRERVPSVDIIVGTFGKNLIPDILNSNEEKIDLFGKDEFSFQRVYGRKGVFRSSMPIMHGCNNYCSYCIVPYVRGREVSRDPEEIVGELIDLDNRGVLEVTLLGQNVNSYQHRKGEDIITFPQLLKEITLKVSNIQWIRFLSSHPKDFPKELISIIAENEKLCNHIHLAVQHGSDKILAEMNRKYTREWFINLVDEIRQEIPAISLTTDLLIGFPGETEEDFELTIDLIEKVRFSDAFTYYYNPREGTKAFNMGDTIPREIKLKRLSRLIEVQRRISIEEKRKRIGNREKVLIEAVSKKNRNELLARTEGNSMVVFHGKAERIGSFTTVDLKDLRGSTFIGMEVSLCHGNS